MPGPLDVAVASGLPDPQTDQAYALDEVNTVLPLATAGYDYRIPGLYGYWSHPGGHERSWSQVWWSIYANGCFKTQTVKLWRNGELFYSLTVGQCGDSTGGNYCGANTDIPESFSGGAFEWTVRELTCGGAGYYYASARRQWLMPPRRLVRSPAIFLPPWNRRNT